MNELSTAQDNAALVKVLQASVFPGASDQSVALAMAYCKAAGYDVMLKPVHIVPMWSKSAGGMRDVIMPGIGLYRIQAARTGQFAGMSEVEFGPQCEFAGVAHPEWAKCTVKRQLSSGLIAEFTAKEFWAENYAEKGGKERDTSPNAMWGKRAYGQISKCAQAQALRMAFPEIGSAPIYEEMDGKDIDTTATAQPEPKKDLPALPSKQELDPEAFAQKLNVWAETVKRGTSKTEPGAPMVAQLLASMPQKYAFTDDQIAQIKALHVETESSEIIEGEVL